MKFKLHRQKIPQNIIKIISKEIARQKIATSKPNPQNLKEMAKLKSVIEKKGLPSYLILRKLKKGLGYGIFLHPEAKPLERGQIIAPYACEVTLAPENLFDDSDYAFSPISDILLTKEEQKEVDPERRHHPRRIYSLNLDAARKGNFTRFINHSDKPNVCADIFHIPKNRYGLTPMPIEIVYVAKKRILPGEQLLVSYEDEEKSYWGAAGITPLPITPQTYTLNRFLRLQERSK